MTGEMSLPAPGAGNDGSRRGRILYSDPQSARRTIMRLPSAPPNAPYPMQDSPLAGRGTTDVAFNISRISHDTAAARASGGRNVTLYASGVQGPAMPDILPHGRPHRVSRMSTQTRHSIRSDPFDLHVSDDEDFETRLRFHENRLDTEVAHVMRERGGMLNHPTRFESGVECEAYVPTSPRSTPSRIMSALTSCFLQDCFQSRPRLDHPQHL
jgi:hypothetical protein